MKVHTQPNHKVMVTGIGRRVIMTAEETYFCPTDFGAINRGRSVRVIRTTIARFRRQRASLILMQDIRLSALSASEGKPEGSNGPTVSPRYPYKAFR